jgi:hypothetical protein
MNKNLLSCLMTLALAGTAQAASLLPPGDGDASPSRLVAAPLPAGEFERQPVSFAWALDPMAELSRPAPHLAESREYWIQADAAELQRGLSIDTTAPGAVIRLSPVDGRATVDPSLLRVSKAGRNIAQPQSFQRTANAAQLRAAGMDVPDGSAIVQLAKEHGQGRFQLQLPKARNRYLVHVYEPDSPYVLKAQAARGQLLAGDTLEVAAVMQRGERALPGGELQGQLVSPSGRSYPLTFGGGKARLTVPLEAGSEPGLWEVQLFAGQVQGGASVQRDARTAIEIARPTARLAGGVGFDAAALRFALPVQVAAEGRYEVRGTLYATGRDGVSRPVSQAQAANWLRPGQRSLALAFDRGHVPTGYGAPFELRFLELKDQTRMGTLETRELAVRERGGSAPVGPVGPVAPVRPVVAVQDRQLER